MPKQAFPTVQDAVAEERPGKWDYLALLLLALVPRLVLGLMFLNLPLGLDDMFQYDMLARSLAGGQGYRWYGRADAAQILPYLENYFHWDIQIEQVPEEGYLTTFRPPGYPLFLALLYRLGGLEHRLQVVRLVQVLLGAALAPMTAWLAQRIGFRRRPALLAGAMIACYPILWIYPIGLGSENLFIPLLGCGFICLLYALRGGRAFTTLAAGFLLGAATLTRSAAALFLPVAALALWKQSGGRKAIAFTLAASAVLLPWMVRNSLALGKPSFIESSFGYNLFIGYHPEGDGSFSAEAAVQPLKYLKDAERERWCLEQVAGFIRADPWEAARRTLHRAAFFWGLEDREVIFFYSNGFLGKIPQPWLLISYLVVVMPLALLALPAGFGMAASRSGGLSLALIASSMAAYVFIMAEARFHLPLVPLLAVFSAYAWTTPGLVRRSLDGLYHGERRWVLAWLAVIGLLIAWGWDLGQEWPRLLAVMGAEGHTLHFNY